MTDQIAHGGSTDGPGAPAREPGPDGARASVSGGSPGSRRLSGTDFSTTRTSIRGDVTVGRGGTFAGRDVHQTTTIIKNKLRQHPVASAVGGALLLSLILYGTVGTGQGSGVDTSVVSQPGAAGALHTAQQMRAAERAGDATAWCEMAAPSEAGCAGSMQGAFARRSQSYRDQVDKVGIGDAAVSGTTAQVPLSWNGQEQGTLPLEWSGGRWQMSSGTYLMTSMAGGVFLSLVDAQDHQLTIGGIPIPS